jgi:hypothetical protein
MLFLRRRSYVHYGSVSDTKVQLLCTPGFDVMTLSQRMRAADNLGGADGFGGSDANVGSG